MTEPNIDKALPRADRLTAISWGGLFGGTLMTLAVLTLLLLLGMGIGLYTMDVATDEDPLSGYGTASSIWWIFCWIVALFVGGWMSSRFAGLQRRMDGLLHGLLCWALSVLLVLYLLGSAIGAIAGGAFSALGTAFDAATEVVQAVPVPDIGQIDAQEIMDEIRQVRRRVEQRGGQEAVRQFTTDVWNIVKDGNITPQERERLEDMMARNTDYSEREVENAVQRLQNAARSLRQELGQAGRQIEASAEEISDAMGAASLWSFLALLLGAVAAAAGGAAGRVHSAVSV